MDFDESDRRVARRHLLTGSAALLAAATLVSPSRAFPPGPPMPPAWPAAEVIRLWPGSPPGGGYAAQVLPADFPKGFIRNIAEPALHLFRPARSNGRALLVMPGGSYLFVSIGNEGVDVARDLTGEGYTVFVLTYRLPGEGWRGRADVPLQDAQRAMRLIGSLAPRFGYDSAKIAAIGFSAGGHLAASLATAFDEPVYAPVDAIDRGLARPAAMGLIYPVIAVAGPQAHADSARLLLGPDPAPALVARRSPAQHVTGATPPLFFVHALDDDVVPPENSLLMLAAAREAHVAAEAHLFEQGGHGFGLGATGAPARAWSGLFARWLDRHL